jgi:hypothetical protein
VCEGRAIELAPEEWNCRFVIAGAALIIACFELKLYCCTGREGKRLWQQSDAIVTLEESEELSARAVEPTCLGVIFRNMMKFEDVGSARSCCGDRR